MGECGSGSCEMNATQVCCGRCSGQLYSGANKLARRPHPVDAEESAGTLAHRRREPSRRGPVSLLRAGDSRPAWVGCGCATLPSAAVRRVRLYRDAAQTVSMLLLCRQPHDDATVHMGTSRAAPPTKAYEPWGLRLLINPTVMDAARKLEVAEESRDGMLDRWIERACMGMYEGFVRAIEEEVP